MGSSFWNPLKAHPCAKRGDLTYRSRKLVQGGLHPSGVAKSSTSFGWGKGGKVIPAGWHVTLCDLIWHVISRSGVVISITNCYIRFTYLLYFVWRRQNSPQKTSRVTTYAPARARTEQKGGPKYPLSNRSEILHIANFARHHHPCQILWPLVQEFWGQRGVKFHSFPLISIDFRLSSLKHVPTCDQVPAVKLVAH